MTSDKARLDTGPGLLPSPLYAIFDASLSQGRSAIEILRDLLNGGAKIIQLRAKEMTSNEFHRFAIEARDLTRGSGCLLIINDRVDIAMATRADGAHLGQEDLPLAVARKLMGKERIIGISTHDPDQARQAEEGGADYIGFGPMFGTTTKDTGYSARGLSMLREVRKAVKLPIVAIGGITEENVSEVWDAGADSAAIISDLMKAEDVTAKVRRILALR